MATKSATTKGTLDPMNMAYGLGASVVLMGAMFKFLNYPYANILILVGFTVEAIVFAISAFERRKEEKEYHWERIFPQLEYEDTTPIERLEELIDQANIDPTVIERLTTSIEKLEQNIKQMSEVSNTAQLAEHIDKMIKVSESYEEEISKLSSRLYELNRFYEQAVNEQAGQQMSELMSQMTNLTMTFENEFKKLNDNIAQMNAHYERMLEVMGAKRNQ